MSVSLLLFLSELDDFLEKKEQANYEECVQRSKPEVGKGKKKEQVNSSATSTKHKNSCGKVKWWGRNKG